MTFIDDLLTQAASYPTHPVQIDDVAAGAVTDDRVFAPRELQPEERGTPYWYRGATVPYSEERKWLFTPVADHVLAPQHHRAPVSWTALALAAYEQGYRVEVDWCKDPWLRRMRLYGVPGLEVLHARYDI